MRVSAFSVAVPARAMMTAAMIALLSATAGPLMAQGAEPGQIRVSGQGKVETAPDMATLTLGITAEADAAADAMGEATRQMTEMLERLRSAGIEARDLQTSGLILSPRWHHPERPDQGQPQITGYIAQNTLTVRVRDLAVLGGILDDVVQAGANTFHGLGFSMADPEPLLDEARRRAIADARRKAELYAEAAGVTLGEVVAIHEPETADFPRPMMRMEAAMADGGIAAGEVTVDAAVTVIYRLAEDE
ncbi:SIMPL domain-containing protein [Plastorhodobacter daqingensis]|uniref:SIMPL domain-containing protein n=1 Tax=Plastorhodobacter daqingensis TaxID=1387281 RepID=A0ABW2UIG9_9RHOB